MKKQLGKITLLIGKLMVISTLFIIVVRSYTIDTFAAYEFKTMLPPAGEIISLNKENFSFSAISDTGARDEILEKIIQKITPTDAAFILYLGDLVRYRNPSHFRWMAEEIYSELNEKSFYAVPGNHDIISEKGKVDRNLYTSIFGQPYYWFVHGNTLFIGLDSSEEKYDDKQIEWLKFILNNIRPNYKNCIIYSHVPPISFNPDVNKVLDNDSKIKFADAIRDKGINLLLSGHVHYHAEGEFEGIPLVLLPSSGQNIRGEIKNYGYINVHINSSDIATEVQYIDKQEDTTDYLELFFSSAIVKKEVAHVGIWLFAFGILLIATGAILRK